MTLLAIGLDAAWKWWRDRGGDAPDESLSPTVTS
jgi:hypothetical protein